MKEFNTLVLGIRISNDSFRRVELQSVDLDGKVEEIKSEAVKQTGLQPDQILLIHGGVALDDAHTLRSYGIQAGVMIHVLKRRDKVAPTIPKAMTNKEIQQLANAFHIYSRNPGYRSALVRLSRADTLENILMAIPGLSQDTIAVSIIRDLELLMSMSDVATIRRALEKHPVLAEAANYIAAAVHEETATARRARRGAAAAAASSAALFSPDAFSGGEEMDSSQSSDSPPARSSASSLGFAGITSSQLEAALAAVGSAHTGASGSGASSSRSSAPDRSGFITPEMFNSALQQAFQGIAIPSFSSSPSSSSRSGPAGTGADNPFAFGDRMQQQLQQMRELGLRDQMFNLQALQITNGDVQAAIELVMSSGGNSREEDEEDDAFQ